MRINKIVGIAGVIMILDLLFLLPDYANAGTLFLAHYNGGLDADYSAGGVTKAEVVGVRVTEGGKGYPFSDSKPSPESADVGYSGSQESELSYLAAGNIDSRQGTIEFWLKTAWDWEIKEVPDWHPAIVYIPLSDKGLIQVYSYVHNPQVFLGFSISDRQGDHHGIYYNVSPVEGKVFWKKNEWHHVAVSWGPQVSRLFADGELVAEETWEKGLLLTPPDRRITVGGQPGRPSRVLIDELRITDTMVEKVEVPKTEHTTNEKNTSENNASAEPEVTAIPCYFTASPPQVDGWLSDSLWQQIPEVTGLRAISGDRSYAPVQSRFQIAYDNEYLYIALFSHEPQIEQIVANRHEDEGGVFMDDALEIFIDPKRNHTVYYQLACNALGSKYDGRGMDASWNGQWKAAAQRGADFWSIEIAVPFSTLDFSPEPGDIWGFNIARDRHAGKSLEFSSWSPIVGGFHAVKEFNAIRFAKPGSYPAKGEAIQLNADYIQVTRSQISRSVKQWQRPLERASSEIKNVSTSADVTALQNSLKRETIRIQALLNSEIKDTSVEQWTAVRLSASGISKGLEQLALAVETLVPTGPLNIKAQIPFGLSEEGGYWYFTSERAVFIIDRTNGAIAGIWDRAKGQRCVLDSHDYYWFETVTETTESEELLDEVTKATKVGDHLILSCINEDLPGVFLTKEYFLKDNGRIMAKKVTVQGKMKEKTLLRISSKTFFDPSFRSGAYYDRVLHPVISVKSFMKAEDVTERVKQPGFMGQTPDGCSQFTLTNLGSGTGIAQYLLKINGKYAYPPRSLDMSYWTNYGWDMSWLSCFVKKEPFSSEMDYHLYDGDHVAFHKEYLELPEVQECRASYKIHPWSSKSRYTVMPYNDWRYFTSATTTHDDPRPVQPPPDVLEWCRIVPTLFRSDEIIYYLYDHLGDRWGSNPAADDEEVVYKDPNYTIRYKKTSEVREPCKMRKVGTAAFKALGYPQYKFGVYQYILETFPDTPTGIAGWYIVDKEGKPVLGWGNGPHYRGYFADFSPEFNRYTVESLGRVLDYYNLDYIYIDWPYGPTQADWKGDGRVLQTTDFMDFYRQLHEICALRGKAVFVNAGSGVPYVDAGYYEGFGDRRYYKDLLEKDWRNLSNPLLMMKLYEPKGFASQLLAWKDVPGDRQEMDNTREIANYTIALGMSSGHCVTDEQGREPFKRSDGQPDWPAIARFFEPIYRVNIEMAGSEIEEVGLSPAWWRDIDTDIEAYTLHQGPAHIFSAINHLTEAKNVELSADVSKMGLTSDKRTFSWQFFTRDYYTWKRQIDPPPQDVGRTFAKITCESEILKTGKKRIEVRMSHLEPDLVRLAVVTQVPGVLYSAEGQKTNLLLPETLGCKIEGELDEKKRVTTLIATLNKPCEILAWWPKEWGEPKATMTNLTIPEKGETNPVEVKTHNVDSEDFVLISLPPGRHQIKVSQ